MGDHSGKGLDNELPVHSVTLSPFSIATHEVSYAKWTEIKNWGESNGYSFNRSGQMGSEEWGGTQDENHPVFQIEWYDAVLWCNALSEMEGKTPCYYTSADKSTVYRSGSIDILNDWVLWEADGYRLPTEAEWECACRAGTTTEYSFGNDIASDDANYYNSGDDYDNGTTPVGYYEPSSWGLYEMHGNVWEWCWDYMSDEYYASSPSTDPHGPDPDEVISKRVTRGGSWRNPNTPGGVLRSAKRCPIYPDLALPGKPGEDVANCIGFRPAQSE